MIPAIKLILFCVTYYLCNIKPCACIPESRLVLYSPGDVEYTDVLVRRVGDNLTLVCEQRGDTAPRVHVWNYVPDNATHEHARLSIQPTGPTTSSNLTKTSLRLQDSGEYMCSAPPFSITKYILVQPRGPLPCARGAFWCGARCVLGAYVCDGFSDCLHGEDEDQRLCNTRGCDGGARLQCGSGRCIPRAACCLTPAALCRQPTCCEEHALHSDALADDYPPLYEDRHAPDDYGFIQSTIYTVTACALIFMIAVVLLVSAICKMHMKRAAVRGYTLAHAHHYAQPPRFPPCYSPPSPRAGTLARLSAVFSTRYTQVPTVAGEVELSPRSCDTYSLNGRTITLGAVAPPSYSEALRHKCPPPSYDELPRARPHLPHSPSHSSTHSPSHSPSHSRPHSPPASPSAAHMSALVSLNPSDARGSLISRLPPIDADESSE